MSIWLNSNNIQSLARNLKDKKNKGRSENDFKKSNVDGKRKRKKGESGSKNKQEDLDSKKREESNNNRSEKDFNSSCKEEG